MSVKTVVTGVATESILFSFQMLSRKAQTAGRDNGAPSRARAACGRTIVAAGRPVAGPFLFPQFLFRSGLCGLLCRVLY
ncbi:hypothetical protein NBRC3293_3140 [Gluconobacter oxydans NBRC 3293]|uniref:Uncharacterized protein n=1 Tax=Gluconobacter oxydans NBRC 3293 TaxID=1315969 RepID=A0A829WT89_GLUOY|nr:hypothetical protein NBRC3293_2912 [Gluconobacter oxydans NBRC 3293]GEM18643.1 hypothetical protein NBRC3293_3140 [Gluconobacter oxydans NBRC 3293]